MFKVLNGLGQPRGVRVSESWGARGSSGVSGGEGGRETGGEEGWDERVTSTGAGQGGAAGGVVLRSTAAEQGILFWIPFWGFKRKAAAWHVARRLCP